MEGSGGLWGCGGRGVEEVGLESVEDVLDLEEECEGLGVELRGWREGDVLDWPGEGVC